MRLTRLSSLSFFVAFSVLILCFLSLDRLFKQQTPLLNSIEISLNEKSRVTAETWETAPLNKDIIEDISRLRNVGSRLTPKPRRTCGERYVRVIGPVYGGTSNFLISLVHGIALSEWATARQLDEDISASEAFSNSPPSARHYSYTLLLPHYATSVLFPFDLNLLMSQYCVRILAHDRLIDGKRVPWGAKWLWDPLAKLVRILKGAEYKLQKQREDLQALVHEAVLQGRMPLINDPPAVIGDVQVTMSELFHLGSPEFLHVWKRFTSGILESPKSFRLSEMNAFMLRKIVPQVAKHYIGVLSAIWTSPCPLLLRAVSRLLTTELRGNLDYHVVHKRQLDGYCATTLYDVSDIQIDFPAAYSHLQRTPAAGTKSGKSTGHPVCDMSPSFVTEIIENSNRMSAKASLNITDKVYSGVHQQIYVSSDAQGDDSDWLAERSRWKAVVGWNAQQRHGLSMMKNINIGYYIDLLTASHARGLFVGNPRSTFSFVIATLRAGLGYPTWPVPLRHDVYFSKPIAREQQWVGLQDIKDVLMDAQLP